MSLQLLRVDGLCFLVWKLQFAFQFFSLPLHCSTEQQQACARGSKLQPHPSSPKSPRLEDQYLEYSKPFHHAKREELAPLPRGDRNYFCQCCGDWKAPLPAAHSACYACRSLADKHSQAISSGNPSANQATAITRYICAIPSWGLRNVDFLVSNNPTKNSVPFLQPCFLMCHCCR